MPAPDWTRRGFVFAADRASLARMQEGWPTRGLAADMAKEAGYDSFVTALLLTRRYADTFRTQKDEAEFRHIYDHSKHDSQGVPA